MHADKNPPLAICKKLWYTERATWNYIIRVRRFFTKDVITHWRLNMSHFEFDKNANSRNEAYYKTVVLILYNFVWRQIGVCVF